jgi:hypothetical protein
MSAVLKEESAKWIKLLTGFEVLQNRKQRCGVYDAA